ncbi:DUF6913 domain-containing protein [Aquimarina longa]|uniref:DUF6913 domain-containing protein n=1 Tax=Aquimarina longa TaxID=1080221 RepID=UPI000AFE4BDD|nr:hypothetical protein [Aquimarina longa]
MILKGLKRNALRKSFETYLDKRDHISQGISRLQTLAVLIDASQSVNIVSILKLANELGVKSDNLTVMGYKEDQKEIIDDKDAAYYNEKNFGISGAIKSKSLQDFVNKDYDVLINFYEKDIIELNYVAAASKAKFKVGCTAVDNRINDLIIGATTNDTNLFISELRKYLKILQII